MNEDRTEPRTEAMLTEVVLASPESMPSAEGVEPLKVGTATPAEVETPAAAENDERQPAAEAEPSVPPEVEPESPAAPALADDPEVTAAPQEPEMAWELVAEQSPEGRDLLLPAEPDIAADDGETEARDRYWQSVLTGNPDTVRDDVRERSGANDVSLSRAQSEYMLFTSINRSWVADHRGISRPELLHNWKKYRSELAAELGVADDERELFMALSQRAQEQPRREIAGKVSELGYLAGLHGDSRYSTEALTHSLRPDERDRANVIAMNAFIRGRDLRERWLPLAQDLAAGLDVFAAVEEDVFSAPRVLAGAPGLCRAVDSLADLNDEDRQIVVYLALRLDREKRCERGDLPEEEGLLSRTTRAVRRGATGMGFGVLQALNHTGIATLNNLGAFLGGEVGDELRKGAGIWDRRMQTLNEIRHIAQQQLVPLVAEDAGRAESFLIEGAQATPAAVLSCCGGAGFAALSLSSMGESVAEARQRAPETPQQLQLAAGVVGGAVQGAIYMGLNRIGGRMLEQTIANFMKARGSGLVNYTFAGLKSMAGMTAEGVKLLLAGKAAAAVDLGAHELAARASATASNIRWQEFGENLVDIEANMREAAATLPFLLIGAGRLALRHFRSPDGVLGAGQRLLEWKVDPERVNEIRLEPNVDRRNTLLRRAICDSKLWTDRRFSFDIMRAMQLLNIEGLPVFEHWKQVCDFLHLSSDFDISRNRRPPSDNQSSRAYKGLLLRDSWEQQAGLSGAGESLQDLRSQNRRDKDGLMTGRGRYKDAYMFSYENPLEKMSFLHNKGLYAPQAEAMRRAIVDTYFGEVRKCSYRLLLQLYSQDVMTHDETLSISELKAEAEQTRQRYMDLVGKTIMDIAGGRDSAQAYDELATGCGQILADYRAPSRRERAPEWLYRSPEVFISDIVQMCRSYDNKRMVDYPDMRTFYRLLHRTRVCASVLKDILPMSDQFQSELSAGKSPAQVFGGFLQRELGCSSEITEMIGTAGDSALRQDYEQKNARQVEFYSELTGHEIEEVQGHDGKPYYRIRRPDGRYTPWHSDRQHAINDIVGNAALTHMPFGTRADKLLTADFHNPEAAFTLPVAGMIEHSGFDQVCSIAHRELSQAWLEDASHLLPGMQRLRFHRLDSSLRRNSLTLPLIRHNEDSVSYEVDNYSALTPLGLAHSRFIVYWQQLLNSRLLSSEHAANFLTNSHVISRAESESIRLFGAPPPYPKFRNIPLRLTPPANIEGMNRLLAEKLGRFTLLYFIARLPELPMPQSVKNWYGSAVFAPEAPHVEGVPEGRSMGFRMGRGERYGFRWINRQSGVRLREFIPRVGYYRRHFSESTGDAFIDRLMPGALGLDPVRQQEQAWGHFLCGDGVFRSMGMEYWNILNYPKEGWLNLSPRTRSLYVNHLAGLCRKEFSGREGGSPEDEDSLLVGRALAELDEVLQLHPDLHLYSFLKDDAGSVRRLSLEAPRQLTEYEKDMLLEYQSEGHIRADYTIQQNRIPDFISTSPRVQSALRLLDLLRLFPEGMPYSSDGKIWWQGRSYGKKEAHPVGLELWYPRESLRGLRNLLWDSMRDESEGTRNSISIAGVDIPLLSAMDIECQPLRNITVYESPHYAPQQLFRLMPGVRDSCMEHLRIPYLVGVRYGMYMGMDEGDLSGRIPIDAHIPLHLFNRRKLKLPNDHGKVSLYQRRMIARANVLRVCEIADYGPEYLESEEPSNGNLPEMLMRLYEDTGFSRRMEGKLADELNPGGLQALRLAADMIRCVAAPEWQGNSEVLEAYTSLKKTADMLRSKPGLIEELAEALVTGRKYSPAVWKNPDGLAASRSLTEVRKDFARTEKSPRDEIREILGMEALSPDWKSQLLQGVQNAADKYDSMVSDPEWVQQQLERQRKKKARLEKAHASLDRIHLRPSADRSKNTPPSDSSAE